MSTNDVSLRARLIWAVIGISAFMVLLWPLDVLGLDPAMRFLVALPLGFVAGVVAARIDWTSRR